MVTDDSLTARLAALQERLAGLSGLLVAFSGGADSAFVLAAAVRAIGADSVVAATAVSASLPSAELAAARSFATSLGVRHLSPHTGELARAGYRENGANRCYFCKAELLETLLPIAQRLGIPAVATGTNADDAAGDFRPGIRAARERGAITPLLDAELTKAQVRAASRAWGLSTWDKPAAACLASRVAYGIEITPGRLARVGRAEVALRRGLQAGGVAPRNLRVRDLGECARVEVDPELVGWLLERPELLAPIEGFAWVEVDPRGFRSGSMNEALELAQPGHLS
ncbi:MAG: ATP-dependent sacrificial sulfur transferase LarE [Mycobacteriales bacterium]